jgi:hypothetical protein
VEVTIKGRAVTLSAPPSHVARQKALLALAQDGWIGLGAALGVCWASRPALKATLAAHKWDGLAFGAAVRDELHGAGVSEEEVAEAAAAALKLIVDSYPKESAVAEHADFTAAPTADSTP